MSIPVFEFGFSYKQGVEPFKIPLRFRFRFKKFNFERFSSGSGSRLFKNLGLGSVRVHRKKAVFTGSRFGSTPC